MNEGKNFFLMFEVKDGGVLSPMDFREENLTPERSIVVADESRQTVWLWHGKMRGLVPRRMALRQAESIKGHGYQVGNAIVCRDLSTLVEMDSRKIGREPITTKDSETFMELFKHAYQDIGNLIFVRDEDGTPADAIVVKPTEEVVPAEEYTEPEPAPAAAPVIEETVVPKYPLKHVEVGDKSPPESSAPLVVKDEYKKAAVILAVMEEYSDIWVSKKDDGHISIEQMDGKICSFSIESGEIVFQVGSFSEIPAGTKTNIEKHIHDLL
jgi:hypothetical protein